ncbi:hypothetical protein QQP08_019495 [Theobroma cacao]|nr:hypothetical protein QQP08_019495 [Theobroma cacao]
MKCGGLYEWGVGTAFGLWPLLAKERIGTMELLNILVPVMSTKECGTIVNKAKLGYNEVKALELSIPVVID